MTELIYRSAVELGQMIATKQVTSREVTEAFLDRIESFESKIKAFITLNDQALSDADAIDARIQSGETLSPLAGVPIAVKDLFCTKGLRTTAGSKILSNWVPPYDSTVTTRLLDAGMVVLGKTNLDEFAMGSSTETSFIGPSHNPWDLERTPGGSGGGSSAAVAGYLAPLATGTDTGGSIRAPGAYTGTVGIKPTYGGVSRYGVIAMASSLDQPGPVARNVLDAAHLHQVMGGYDPMDSTSINQPLPDLLGAVRRADVKGMKIGVVKELGGEGYQPGVEARFREAVDALIEAGAEVREVSCPHFDYSLATYYLIMPAEVSSNLARFDGIRYGLRVGDDGSNSVADVMELTRDDGFGAEAKRRIILGTYALSSGYYDAYYGSAQKVRTLIRQDFENAFASCDVLISPATPTTAFKLGERINDPMAMYKADLCTIPANLAGNAAGSFPIGLSEDSMPVGLQVMAPVMRDDLVYQVGACVEQIFTQEWGGELTLQARGLDGHAASVATSTEKN